MIGGLGWQELLIVLVIIALIFGASRVADLGGALGRGIREFRTEARGDEEEEASAEEGDEEDEEGEAEEASAAAADGEGSSEGSRSG
ncbi:MAG: twin-arginine translocase TatA/TatE family subunit [Chloroflexi bacterium]|nr:twin-arginine translocase TatA/TatE family subunit [Chloroflexota bacterium]MYE32302.1 twin-arginine translocase TatA/TatE family subunit [Chloroflexota bacterium]